MDVIDVISANLPLLRELRGRMGQLELAERVGVSRRTIARLENAEVTDPGVDLVGRIGRALGVTVATLTECPLEAVEVPLPEDVYKKLQSDEAAKVLETMIRAARTTTG